MPTDDLHVIRKRRRLLSTRVAGAMTAMLLPLVVTGSVAYAAFGQSTQDLRELSGRFVDDTVAIASLKAAVGQAEALASGHVTGGAGRAAGEYETERAKVEQMFTSLQCNGDDDASRAAVDRTYGAWRAARAIADPVVAAPPPDLSATGYPLAAFHPAMAQVERGLDVADDQARARVDAGTADLEDRRREVATFLGLIVASSLTAAALIWWRLRRSIRRPLDELHHGAFELGAEHLDHRVAVLADDELGAVATAFNTMAERLAQSRQDLTHQAFHDPLTGLANRSLFSDRTSHALARAARNGEAVAVVFFDADDFKVVNDTLGHASGDELLEQIAERLAGEVRAEDTVARFGGDEFALLVENVSTIDEVTWVANRVSAALALGFEIGGRQVSLQASMGVATTLGEPLSAEQLLRHADVAMYDAKAAGKGGFRIYEAAMGTTLDARLALEADLRRAVEQGQFHLVYQPIVDLPTGLIRGVEALVRWDHPERGMVMPLDFIPVAEQAGLIVPLGRWVLEEACRQACALKARYPDLAPFHMSVNLSMRQLQEPGLAADVARVLDETGLDGTSLVLEITESMLMHDVPLAKEVLAALKVLGVSIALDDFGTGYSSLSYLRQFSVDIVKIDKSFVDGVNSTSAKDEEVAHAIIRLGQVLQLQTVAEGIEEAGQADRLSEFGCNRGQGFLFARPLKPADLDAVLQRESRSALPA